MAGFNEFMFGTPQKNYQVSTLGPEQEPLKNQAIAAGRGRGAGGAFGDSADYYRNLLSDDSEDYNAFAAPEMRRYQEQTIPDLAEQFAGMGSGALSGSGFRNASVSAGTDLGERLGAIRAQLRQQGAQGLQNIGSQGLQSFYNNVTQPGTPGFIDYAGPAIGAAATAFGGPLAGAAAGGLTNWLTNKSQRNSSPYGGQNAAMQGLVPGRTR